VCDFIKKVYGQKEVTQNHENENIRTNGRGEAQDRNCYGHLAAVSLAAVKVTELSIDVV
jgi:hypothetical protein